MPSKLLNLGNPKKVIENLRNIVSADAIAAIETEVGLQTQKLYTLGLRHYKFAVAQERHNWRQKISRLYYSSYAASRATRLYVFGEFSSDVTDHGKIGKLPNDFPNKSSYANKLTTLREDRNSCDYDHSSSASDLLIPIAEAVVLARDFLTETRTYLGNRGLNLRGKP